MANEMELVGGAATRKKHAILEPVILSKYSVQSEVGEKAMVGLFFFCVAVYVTLCTTTYLSRGCRLFL